MAEGTARDYICLRCGQQFQAQDIDLMVSRYLKEISAKITCPECCSKLQSQDLLVGKLLDGRDKRWDLSEQEIKSSTVELSRFNTWPMYLIPLFLVAIPIMYFLRRVFPGGIKVVWRRH